MGACISTAKVRSSNSNNNNNNTVVNHNRKETTRPQKATTKKTTAASTQEVSQHQQHQRQNKRNETQKNNRNSQHLNNNNNPKDKRRHSGLVPCGKRTDFGYDKDFDKRYTIGKLLGHGQFGYTYVATDKANGDRVAVKKIEKNKVLYIYIFIYLFMNWVLCILYHFIENCL